MLSHGKKKKKMGGGEKRVKVMAQVAQQTFP